MWVDTAKGLAIVLVVQFHSVLFLSLVGGTAPFWETLNAPLETFRMPLFFFTAGLFAAATLGLPFRRLMNGRVNRLLWLYALWTFLLTLLFRVFPVDPRAYLESSNPLTWWVFSFVRPNDCTWFVYALAIYFLLGWLIRTIPPVVQLGLAGVLSLAAGLLAPWGATTQKTATYFVFFLLAVHLGPAVRRAAPAVRWPATLALLGGYAAAAVVATGLHVVDLPGVRLALGLVAAPAGCALAVVLSRHRWPAILSWLGRRTLPIYLLHFSIILRLVSVLLVAAVAVPPAIGLILPPVVTAVAIALSLGVYAVSRRVPGLWDVPWRRR